MEPFTVKHYSSDERPTIKGNGFDGLEIGGSRDEAEEFITFVNKLIESLSQPVGQVVETYAGHGGKWDGTKSVYPAALTDSLPIGTKLYTVK